MEEREQQHIFESWLSQHKGLLFKVVRAYASTLPDQDDLFQEVILQVWRSIPSFRQESAVTTWLYRIALNTALKWTSKEQKHQDGRESWKWLVVPAAYVLSYVVVRWELQRRHLPRKRELEALRDLLADG